MNNLHSLIITLAAGTLCLPFYSSAQSDTGAQENPEQMTRLKNEAMGIVKQFASSLKPQLKNAMQTGGPVLAIEVCSIQAPAIAENLSTENGWTVTRVSLKPRNNHSATADKWEAEVLKQFDARQQDGEAANKLVYEEIIDGQYRLMKAQPVEPLCLTCHGQNISTEVTKALGNHYADDQATGYSLGQVRGAISVSRKL